MPTETPFPIPPGSPFFPSDKDGNPYFLFYDLDRHPMSRFHAWPPDWQARCAAMAYMAWCALSIDPAMSFSACVANTDECSAAYKSAMARIKEAQS